MRTVAIIPSSLLLAINASHLDIRALEGLANPAPTAAIASSSTTVVPPSDEEMRHDVFFHVFFFHAFCYSSLWSCNSCGDGVVVGNN